MFLFIWHLDLVWWMLYLLCFSRKNELHILKIYFDLYIISFLFPIGSCLCLSSQRLTSNICYSWSSYLLKSEQLKWRWEGLHARVFLLVEFSKGNWLFCSETSNVDICSQGSGLINFPQKDSNFLLWDGMERRGSKPGCRSSKPIAVRDRGRAWLTVDTWAWAHEPGPCALSSLERDPPSGWGWWEGTCNLFYRISLNPGLLGPLILPWETPSAAETSWVL